MILVILLLAAGRAWGTARELGLRLLRRFRDAARFLDLVLLALLPQLLHGFLGVVAVAIAIGVAVVLHLHGHLVLILALPARRSFLWPVASEGRRWGWALMHG